MHSGPPCANYEDYPIAATLNTNVMNPEPKGEKPQPEQPEQAMGVSPSHWYQILIYAVTNLVV